MQVNEYRRDNGLQALSPNEELDAAAEEFALYLAENDQFDHHADGRTPAERATQSGYQYCTIRENIAYQSGFSMADGSDISRQFVQGWIDSEGHRETMLAEFVSETGVAVATVDETAFYAVQMFGKSRSHLFEVELTNRTNQTQEVVLEQAEAPDTIELQPMARFTVQSCLPVTLTLGSAGPGLSIQEESSLEIVPDSDNEAKLQKVEASG